MKETWYALKDSDSDLIESAIAHVIVTGSSILTVSVNKPFVAPFSHTEFLASLEIEKSATVCQEGHQTEDYYKFQKRETA